MKRLNSLRPSPAMIVALVALFAALGGSAYAATKIGTNQIKSNAVTAGKIKKNAVTNAKIKNGAVTGSKINLSTLGTVPSATHATTADSATSATSAKTAETAKTAGTATNFSRYSTIGLVKASPGQDPTLSTSGPFTVTGHCSEIAAGEFEAFTTITTTAANSMYGNAEENYYEGEFQPGEEAELNYSISGTVAEPESNAYYGDYYGSFTADSPDGKTLLTGEMYSAAGYYGAPCSFWGYSINSAP